LVTDDRYKDGIKDKDDDVQILQVYLNSKDVLILMVMVFQIKMINVLKAGQKWLSLARYRW
jgi:hypothetical protein